MRTLVWCTLAAASLVLGQQTTEKKPQDPPAESKPKPLFGGKLNQELLDLSVGQGDRGLEFRHRRTLRSWLRHQGEYTHVERENCTFHLISPWKWGAAEATPVYLFLFAFARRTARLHRSIELRSTGHASGTAFPESGGTVLPFLQLAPLLGGKDPA